MPVEAAAISVLKQFKFRLEINGLPAALVQHFNPGVRTNSVTQHAGAGQNHPAKEVGMLNYGNCTLGIVSPLDGPGRVYFEDWMNLCQDPVTGNGQIPATYLKNFTLYELDPKGDPSRVWEYKRGFPVSFTLGDRHSLGEAANVIEELEIAYESRTMRIIS